MTPITIDFLLLVVVVGVAYLLGMVHCVFLVTSDVKRWRERTRVATARVNELEERLAELEMSGATDYHEVATEYDNHGVVAAVRKLRRLKR